MPEGTPAVCKKVRCSHATQACSHVECTFRTGNCSGGISICGAPLCVYTCACSSGTAKERLSFVECATSTLLYHVDLLHHNLNSRLLSITMHCRWATISDGPHSCTCFTAPLFPPCRSHQEAQLPVRQRPAFLRIFWLPQDNRDAGAVTRGANHAGRAGRGEHGPGGQTKAARRGAGAGNKSFQALPWSMGAALQVASRCSSAWERKLERKFRQLPQLCRTPISLPFLYDCTFSQIVALLILPLELPAARPELGAGVMIRVAGLGADPEGSAFLCLQVDVLEQDIPSAIPFSRWDSAWQADHVDRARPARFGGFMEGGCKGDHDTKGFGPVLQWLALGCQRE